MPSVVEVCVLIGASEQKPGPYIRFDEMRSLRRLQREQEPRSPFVFTSERGSPFTTAGFARMLERAGEAAGLALEISPAHAQACMWLRAGEQGPRHAGAAPSRPALEKSEENRRCAGRSG